MSRKIEAKVNDQLSFELTFETDTPIRIEIPDEIREQWKFKGEAETLFLGQLDGKFTPEELSEAVAEIARRYIAAGALEQQ